MNGVGFEYIGYIESINIKGMDRQATNSCLSLVNLKGDNHWSFLLDHSTEPLGTRLCRASCVRIRG